MLPDIDTSKSLAELTGKDWGPAPEGCRETVRERHELHRKPLGSLNNEELHKLFKIGADYDYEFIIPVALSRLKQDPEILGLLCIVLGVDSFSWREHPEYVRELREIVYSAVNQVGQITSDLERLSHEASIWRCYAEFERGLSVI